MGGTPDCQSIAFTKCFPMGGAPDCESIQTQKLIFPDGGHPRLREHANKKNNISRWGAPPIARQTSLILKQRQCICMMGSQDGCCHPCRLAVGGIADCETPREILVYDWEPDTGAAPVPSSQSYMTGAPINFDGAGDGGCRRLREETGASTRPSSR